MPDLTIRPIVPDEFPSWARTVGIAFGSPFSPDTVTQWQESGFFEYERSLAAFRDDRLVGTALAHSFRLTLPGSTEMPVAGVADVTVLPTDRRRGILTALMRRQLGDVRERGESVAILHASEGSIYGRFGYGPTTRQIHLSIGKADTVLRPDLPESGDVRLLTRQDAESVLPTLYDRWRRDQPGALSQSNAYWTRIFRDPPDDRHGSSERMYAISHAPLSADPNGYAIYRTKAEWGHGVPCGTLTIHSLIALSPTARVTLWRYLLGMDLMGTVEWRTLPVDDPIRWMLSNERAARVLEDTDMLWLRLVDVQSALSARRYSIEGEIVLDIRDPFCPQNEGRYLLNGGPLGAHCAPTTRRPDLQVDIRDLASAYLGGVHLTTLGRAGLVQADNPAALLRADLMFGSTPLPACLTFF